jgi:hypothetical protein
MMDQALKNRTPEEIHRIARSSTLYTVESLPGASRQDVMRQQGLCEIAAARALKQLTEMGKIVCIDRRYYVPEDAPLKPRRPKW